MSGPVKRDHLPSPARQPPSGDLWLPEINPLRPRPVPTAALLPNPDQASVSAGRVSDYHHLVGRLGLDSDLFHRSSSDPKWRVFESVHISTHIIYAVLTEKALNPFVECASGLLSGEGFSITLKFGCKRSIEHIQSLSELPSGPDGTC